MRPERQRLIRALFDEYIEMYAARDDRLTTRFSENFSGYAGSSPVLVKDVAEWIDVTRQDFAQIPERLGIEILDLSMQEIGEQCAIVTAFFHIHLPLPDKFLADETARLVLVFQLEGKDWKIVHSGISIPYRQAAKGEIYPLKSLHTRNRELEALVAERTRELQTANQKLEALSYTDGLTGIANRRYFDSQLAREWNRAKRASHPLSLLLIDIDHFKEYNDHYGHLAGDACLQAFARTFSETARRGTEFAARYGGEEFVVLLPSANEQQALEIASRIQHTVWSLQFPHKKMPRGIVTVSIGVSTLIPAAHLPAEELIRAADWGLYQAKKSGRDTFCLVSERQPPTDDDCPFNFRPQSDHNL
ncbi:MAG: diguanylate cyclase [Burkholderiaceae bacterium]|nr:diguanylate cyclase [Burkholderiaceae bacterium]